MIANTLFRSAPRRLVRPLAFAACLIALSACDDSKTSQKDQGQETQSSAEQAEVQKYNAYVEVANSVQRSYAEDLSTYKSYIQPVFDRKDKNDNLFFSSSSTMGRIKDNLDKARAMKPDMAEIDGPAQAYSEALGKADPVDRDMGNYIGAKTYLSDKGAHGREIQPAYISAMTALAQAQTDYVNAIDAKDRARIKAEFDKTEKDTAAYFRIGMVYHIKDSMDLAASFIDGKGLGDKKDPFKASLDQFGQMATGYDNKMREKNKTGCSAIMFEANAYLSTGRQIIQRTEDGSYEKDKQHGSQFQLMQSREREDAKSLMQNYNDMISKLNENQC
ncbi:YiiG family protein [Neorhizobium sp. NCHU2750]|uniref:YiiG family protein n=1 Tax=Neorhizobium sp. NCHU2750 TaxID=1825976 RepID=UPI000E75FD5D|nr:hypothetical protein NCHU2750_09160 [Neorhizobium sp. NCHU2750]